MKARNTSKIHWIDFKALERDDVDENYSFLDFLIFGNRWVHKNFWWLMIPPLTIVPAISGLFSFISMPLRWYINGAQLKKLRSNAYDIEDTNSYFRLIRNENGNIGLCEWGESYEFSRKVILPSQYAKIERLNNEVYIITDLSGKMGLYNTVENKWIFMCTCDKISIKSDNIIDVTINKISQRYNYKGDRILS